MLLKVVAQRVLLCRDRRLKRMGLCMEQLKESRVTYRLPLYSKDETAKMLYTNDYIHPKVDKNTNIIHLRIYLFALVLFTEGIENTSSYVSKRQATDV